MDKVVGKNSAGRLYPTGQPYRRHMMDVGEGHTLYVEEYGNPRGIPVVVLHGGPGGGCSPMMRQFFNPGAFRVVLFDQRGCGRSRPHSSVEDNTTWHLVRDIEHIRAELGIEKWIVFGGSWGATLSLVYAQTHPNRVAWLVLRGVFLGTKPELDWFYGGGAGRFWPDLWQKFIEPIPLEERDDLIRAYNTRLFSGDPKEEMRFAKLWTAWENALASVDGEGVLVDTPTEYARAFARLENHYFFNRVFLGSGQQILDNMDKLANVPGTIVQGRLDMICPPETAWKLHHLWPKSELRFAARSGHALSEPGIAAGLVEVMDRLADRRSVLGI